MQKTIFIKAEFKPEYKSVKVKVPTGETKKSLLGRDKPVTKKEYKDEPTGNLDLGQIDGEQIADKLQVEIEKLNSEGFTVQSITPITSGTYEYKFKAQGVSSSKRMFSETESVSGGASYGYGYGYGQGGKYYDEDQKGRKVDPNGAPTGPTAQRIESETSSTS